MNPKNLSVLPSLLLAALLAAPVAAEDEAPAEAPAAAERAAEPAKAEPTKEAPAPEPAAEPPPPAPKPKPAPAPAVVDKPKPAAAPAAKAAPPAACLVDGPAADLVGCVGAYKTLSDGYLEAYKAVDRWLAGLSSEMKSAADRIADMEAKVAESEAGVTKLKLDRSKDSKLKLKELELANKKLWVELEAARKDEEVRCKGFAREAAAKVKEINLDITARLAAAGKAAQ